MARMLSRLSNARNTAEQAGLNDTAERIEVLRRELASMKDLPQVSQAARAAWAIAKVDETKASMERETAIPKQVLKDRQAREDIRALGAKIILTAGAMFSGLKAVLSGPEHPVMIVSAFVIGTVVAAGIIDNMIGSKNEKDAAEDIAYILDGIRKELTCGLWRKT